MVFLITSKMVVKKGGGACFVVDPVSVTVTSQSQVDPGWRSSLKTFEISCSWSGRFHWPLTSGTVHPWLQVENTRTDSWVSQPWDEDEAVDFDLLIWVQSQSWHSEFRRNPSNTSHGPRNTRVLSSHDQKATPFPSCPLKLEREEAENQLSPGCLMVFDIWDLGNMFNLRMIVANRTAPSIIASFNYVRIDHCQWNAARQDDFCVRRRSVQSKCHRRRHRQNKNPRLDEPTPTGPSPGGPAAPVTRS